MTLGELDLRRSLRFHIFSICSVSGTTKWRLEVQFCTFIMCFNTPPIDLSYLLLKNSIRKLRVCLDEEIENFRDIIILCNLKDPIWITFIFKCVFWKKNWVKFNIWIIGPIWKQFTG
jgi:hypothetical protein